ncbi:MAG: decaprenyl-phosphate phosphoribosyltransferase [Myxococcota bacterium]
MLAEIVRTLRPHQWVKNLFVLAPLVFAEHALEARPLVRAGGAFLLFSLLSGCVYLLNDIVDIESDRLHPTKRHRPIPAGRLSLGMARLTLAILLLGTIAGSFALSTDFAAVGLAYFALNVGYSFSLKHIPFVDVLSIAAGFILRLFGGAVAIDVPVSLWLGACTFLLATYLGLGKRKHELAMAGEDATHQRRVLERYELEHIKGTMAALAVATLGCYAAYTLLGETMATFSPRDLVWTLPFVAFGLWRFYRLTERTEQGRSPTDLMLGDPPFLVNLALWGAVVVIVIYLR